MNISAVILTKNDQDTIKKVLESVSFCSQVLVIDDDSSDDTASIAKKMGAQVYKRKLDNNLAKQRNFGLNKAKHDWVLFIDSDELVTQELKQEIRDVLPDTEKQGFYIPRKDMFLGKKLKHGEAGNIKLLRLAKKSKGYWRRAIHEVWKVEGDLGTLKNPILHERDISISQFIERINFYTSIDAQELKSEGKKYGFAQLIFKPIGKFFYNYIILLGFLDGVQGFIFAYIMSLHSIIVRVKQWENKSNA